MIQLPDPPEQGERPRLHPSWPRAARGTDDTLNDLLRIPRHAGSVTSPTGGSARRDRWAAFGGAVRQRRVVRWLAAYVGGTWMVLQGMDVLSNIWNWPLGPQRLFCVAMGLGVFPALVLAWYHGADGRQRATPREIVVIAALLLASGAFLWHTARPDSGEPALERTTEAITPTGPCLP